MVEQNLSAIAQSASKNIFPFIPVPPAKRSTGKLARTASSTPDLSRLGQPSTLGALVSSLSLNEGKEQPVSTPTERKVQSESSSSDMESDTIRDITLATDYETKPSTGGEEQFYLKVRDVDDVFGQSSISASPEKNVAEEASSSRSVAKTQADLAAPIPFKQNPRADRMNSPITPANAQGVLPPEACVFAANLAMQRSDEELEASCHEHFDVFGECHIKVRRDKHRHPFALVQYYTVENANEAIRSSRDVVIDDRIIRTEHAQARRSLVLSRTDGRMIAADEARNILGQFGPINQVHPTTSGDSREFGLPQGVWVQFTYYLDYKDALKSFQDPSSQYYISLPPEVEPRPRPGPANSPMFKGYRTPRSVTDQKSIFVGNLPSGINDQDLHNLFEGFGTIRGVNIIRKPIQGGHGYNVFGFVEFTSINEANQAANAEVAIEGIKIRVEPKEYSARRHTRLQPFSPIMSPFNRGRTPGFGPIYNQNIPLGYHPGYFGVRGVPFAHAPYNQNLDEISPFHQGGLNNLFATPPSSNRMMRRNEMAFSGSPHNVQPWSPFLSASGYGGGMMQIPEEFEGRHY